MVSIAMKFSYRCGSVKRGRFIQGGILGFLCWAAFYSLITPILQGAESEAFSLSPRFADYANPIQPETLGWEDYGAGDPFVFRFNGRYYLYVSTRDDAVGVRCWVSRNLTEWEDAGLCCDDPVTKGAYAPEVIYVNGSFYMYTSPAGHGHYILKSDSPTGPFCRVSENLGLTIDGSVFIDDDGAGYFYHASDTGILAHRMTSPEQIDPTPIPTGASMNGWTEGPGVFKVDGRYYLTYTGNHVLSDGYRINAASGDSPLTFTPTPQNPILVKSPLTLYDDEGRPQKEERKLCGIGHNSVVKGPNLDVYYMVYHSLVGRGRPGWPRREMNIDRLVLNGDQVSAIGPTRRPTQINLADIAVYFDDSDALQALRPLSLDNSLTPPSEMTVKDGALRLAAGQGAISSGVLSGDFTAEWAFAAESGESGALFCYRDAENYGRFGVDTASNRMTVTFVRSGTPQFFTFDLPKCFGTPVDFTKWESIQVERAGGTFSFYVNDRFLASKNCDLPSGQIGCYSLGDGAKFSYWGGTAASGGRSAARLAELIPGTLTVKERLTRRGETPVIVVHREGSRFWVQELIAGDTLDFNIAAETGLYDLALRAVSSRGASASITLDGVPITPEISIEKTSDLTDWSPILLRGVSLSAGENRRLSIEAHRGRFLAADLTLVCHEAVSPLTDFSSFRNRPAYSDGEWQETESGLLLAGENNLFGKRLYGREGWGDYRVRVDITLLDAERFNAGLLIRGQNPAQGGPNHSPCLGTDFFLGYFIGFGPDSIKLSRHRYDWKPLCETPFSVSTNRPIHLEVTAVGNVIQIAADGQNILEYADADPILWGAAGFRACDTPVQIENFAVEPLAKR